MRGVFAAAHVWSLVNDLQELVSFSIVESVCQSNSGHQVLVASVFTY